MRFVAVLFLMALSLYVTAYQNTPIMLCGRQLAKARDLLCFGRQNVNKRGTPPNSLLENVVGDSHEELEWPWSGRPGALSASWSRYKRGGIADECCLKPCTTDDILNYC